MTTPMPSAQSVRSAGSWFDAADQVTLTYEERVVRRKHLSTVRGDTFLADLSETTRLAAGDALELVDGRLIEVVAAEEPLLKVTGANLMRLTWHIGNRHIPCQIGHACLFVRPDHALADLLRRLGAELSEATGPFCPDAVACVTDPDVAHLYGQQPGHTNDHPRVHHHVGHHHTAEDPEADEVD